MKRAAWRPKMRLFIFFPRRFLLGCIVGAVLLATVVLQQGLFRSYHVFGHPYFGYDVTAEEPLNADQTCLLPRFHPFDSSILPYLSENKPILCKYRHRQLTYIDDAGYLQFNETAMAEAGYTAASLKCTYRAILRKDGMDDAVVYGPEVPFKANQSTPIVEDFISVSCCNLVGITVYSWTHAHVRNLTRPMEVNSSYYNVLIFGLDSMSRLSTIRLLPNTYRYLTETMGAYVFRGMNKVADNTFPNLVALLTGKEAYGGELPHPPKKIKTFDSWPIIWKNFSEAGYITMFAEDFPEFGLFNYLSTGFKDPPTDYYLRPFWLALPESLVLRTSSHMCYGPMPKHMLQVEFVERFLKKYRNVNYFAFSFLAELSHDYLFLAGAADGDFLSVLRFLFEGGYLNNTLFIFMSDHGHRFDSLRETLLGRIEERMPFFSLYVPDRLLQEQPHIVPHLQTNVARLVTHYDTFDTLSDVLSYSLSRKPLGKSSSRFGRTLFGPIPSNRTCQTSGIPDHYCTCETELPMALSEELVPEVAKTMVEKLNDLLKEGLDKKYRSLCAKLTLKRVKSAYLLSPNKNVVHTVKVKESLQHKVRAIIETSPGGGLFEATIRVSEDGSLPSEVLGDISRINKYGDQSSCIKHEILRKYCFCTQ